MAFPIIDQIERLINEHGSAAILRDHLALLREQLATFTQKLSACEAANKEAQAANEQLKIHLSDANSVIDLHKKADENRKKNGPKFAESDYDPFK